MKVKKELRPQWAQQPRCLSPNESTTEKEPSREPLSPWSMARVEALPKQQPHTYTETEKNLHSLHRHIDMVCVCVCPGVKTWGCQPPDLIKALLLPD